MIHLYIKQHQITGLKYFGQTRQNPFSYKGSGKLWLRHIGKYGRSKIDTLSVWSYHEKDIEEAKKTALEFSINENIVESDEWANLMIEDVERGLSSYVFTEEAKQRIRDGKQRSGYKHSEEVKQRIREASTGRKQSAQALEKMSRWKTEHPLKHTQEAKDKMCAAKLGKSLSTEHRAKISKGLIGRIVSEETRQKLSAGRRGKSGYKRTPEEKRAVAEKAAATRARKKQGSPAVGRTTTATAETVAASITGLPFNG